MSTDDTDDNNCFKIIDDGHLEPLSNNLTTQAQAHNQELNKFKLYTKPKFTLNSKQISKDYGLNIEDDDHLSDNATVQTRNHKSQETDQVQTNIFKKRNYDDYDNYNQEDDISGQVSYRTRRLSPKVNLFAIKCSIIIWLILLIILQINNNL